MGTIGQADSRMLTVKREGWRSDGQAHGKMLTAKREEGW
jgi:hypothetical protein